MGKQLVLRAAVVLTVVLGANYVVWRWLASVSWSAWWVAVPLVLAETWTLVDAALLGAVAWQARRRPAPPGPVPGLAVDVVVTTDGERSELVLRTVEAALALRYPHRTWVIGDAAQPGTASAVQACGAGYVERPAAGTATPTGARSRTSWADDLDVALGATEGDLLLVLDGSQTPDPDLLDRVLGYFEDERVALVEVPQQVVGVPAGDPLGVLAPRYAGTLARGRDGWGASFVGDAAAVLRRDALLQLGLVGRVREAERSVRAALHAARKLVAHAQRTAPDPVRAAVLRDVQQAAGRALDALDDGEPLSEVTSGFQRQVDAISAAVVARDVAAIQADLEAIAALGAVPDALAAPDRPSVLDVTAGREHADDAVVLDAPALARLADRDWSPLGAIASVQELVRAVDLGRSEDARPGGPVVSAPGTEDLATTVRLHALGWRSVLHPDALVRVPAPEDLRAVTAQRLRRAQGVVQVLLRETRLRIGRPRIGRPRPGQRLVRVAALWDSLTGVAALPYLLVPAVVLVAGAQPVRAWDRDLGLRLVPYVLAGQLLLVVASGGLRGWRHHQLGLVQFPWRLRAVLSAIRAVRTGRPVREPRTDPAAAPWRTVAPQLAAAALLVVAAVVGAVRAGLGQTPWAGTAVVLGWAAFDLVVLGAVLPPLRRHRQDRHDPDGHGAASARRAG